MPPCNANGDAVHERLRGALRDMGVVHGVHINPSEFGDTLIDGGFTHPRTKARIAGRTGRLGISADIFPFGNFFGGQFTFDVPNFVDDSLAPIIIDPRPDVDGSRDRFAG